MNSAPGTTTAGHGGLVHGVDGVAVGCLEGHVQFPGLGAGGRAQPEHRDAIRAGP